MIIFTQDRDVAVFDQYIRMLYVRPCEAENEETGETHDAWAVAADIDMIIRSFWDSTALKVLRRMLSLDIWISTVTATKATKNIKCRRMNNHGGTLCRQIMNRA